MKLAAPYYPEHWPRKRWEEDAQLMKDAGLKRIRMGEFAWAEMEPQPGQFNFNWLKEAIELFARYNIETILCTPTPTYPPWLHQKYPDIHQIKSEGTVKEYGQRQDACKNHPGYNRYADRITEKMLQELGDNPNVVAWQTDNEFGCHGTVRCYCDFCQEAFQEWLRTKYDNDIERLNKSWGTFFWSQKYNEFSEIALPRDTADRESSQGQNPGLVLDFYRFSSDVQVKFQKKQIELIKKYAPDRIITHNLMGLFSDIDYFDLAEDLDVVSWDNYPFAVNGTNRPPEPLAHDLMRGLKQKEVWVMEQASGPGGWSVFAANPQPNQMRLWAYQAVARGADMISFFRWRTCRFGREQYWHGILPHHGHPGRRYEEVKKIGQEFQKINEELKNSTVNSKIAVLYDYSSLWALDIQPHVEEGFGYIENAARFDRAVSRLGLCADVVGIDSDLSSYDIIFAPAQHVLTTETAEKLKKCMKQGTVIVFGPRSGVKDRDNAVVNEYLPGKLREFSGCYVEEYDAFDNLPDFEMELTDNNNHLLGATGLAEVLVTEQKTAEPILFYNKHYYAGRPAAVRNKVGAGESIYLGTVLEEEGFKYLIKNIITEKEIDIPENKIRTDLPECIEVVARTDGQNSYTFYLNHSDSDITINLSQPGQDLFTGAHIQKTHSLDKFGVMIVKEE